MQAIRKLIKKIVPNAVEIISYSIPSLNYNGTYLVYFAGFKNHIGLNSALINNKQNNAEFKNREPERAQYSFH